MAEGERDSTEDWVLPAEARPATLAQLEQRIDYAVAVAKASEAAALEIGAAALDAAEQARRAAEIAERAAAGGGVVAERVAPVAEDLDVVVDGNGAVEFEEESAAVEPELAPEIEPEPTFDSFKHFLERANRVEARLEAIAPST